MKKFHLLIITLLFNSSIIFSQVAINTDGSAAANSAMLDVKSNSKGFLPPRMTHAELNSIPTPADGLIVYCSDCGPNGTGTLSMFTAGAWYSLSANCINPLPPATGNHVASITQIIWNWNAVTGATGYKWNTTNDYGTATDMGNATAKTETGLTCGTAYTRYVWAYGTCGNSISLALSQSTSTCAAAPTVSTTAVSAITQTNAISGANVTADGGAAVTARGICWSTNPNPTTANTKTTDGTGTGSVISSISGLSAGTTYYVRAYATNSSGTAYGNEASFTTLANLPTVTTTAATSITATTATSGANITSDGGATVTARGVCWSTVANPTTADPKTTDGTGTGSVASSITGLVESTTYYVRAYATNSAGTAYGTQVSFTTSTSGVVTVTDIDGNVYNTITIGTQVWMAENLKTTKYRNGDAIPNVIDNTAWSVLITGAYCNYNNDAAIAAIYGKLYNWYAASDARNIAPTGWHVPTDAEWTTLITYLGGASVAGGKMKEAGTAHWQSASSGATNESGFTALPGGGRDFSGSFPPSNDIYYRGNWWSTTKVNPLLPAVYFRMIENASNFITSGSYYNGAAGFSIRCVKD